MTASVTEQIKALEDLAARCAPPGSVRFYGQVSDHENEIIEALLQASEATPSEKREIEVYARERRTIDDVRRVTAKYLVAHSSRSLRTLRKLAPSCSARGLPSCPFFTVASCSKCIG